MIKLTLPISEEEIRKLKTGDEVSIWGTLVTARDAAHKYMIEKKPEYLHKVLNGSIIYHCGPIVKQEGKKYTIVSAGPTTSIREEPYQAEVIRLYSVRGVIGKGGMGRKTLDACRNYGAVYLSATGGLAAVLANAIKDVEDVFMLKEFGIPEAMWVVRVEDFPAVVTMDSHGKSLHEEILEISKKAAAKLTG